MGVDDAVLRAMLRRLAALAGQLRGVVTLVEDRYPSSGIGDEPWWNHKKESAQDAVEDKLGALVYAADAIDALLEGREPRPFVHYGGWDENGEGLSDTLTVPLSETQRLVASRRVRKASHEFEMPVEDPENGFGGLDAWECLPEMSPFSGRRVRVTVEDLGPDNVQSASR